MDFVILICHFWAVHCTNQVRVLISSSNKASADENVPKLLACMEHHLGCVNCIRWSGSGTFLASGGDDKLVSLTLHWFIL